jgi:hypothetical protein
MLRNRLNALARDAAIVVVVSLGLILGLEFGLRLLAPQQLVAPDYRVSISRGPTQGASRGRKGLRAGHVLPVGWTFHARWERGGGRGLY